MSGFNTILMVHKLEKAVDELGFVMCQPKYDNQGSYGSTVTLRPKDAHSLPIYSRDAEVFQGTLEQLEYFIKGIMWSRHYDEMLRLSNTVKRERKEQDVRNKNLVEILKA